MTASNDIAVIATGLGSVAFAIVLAFIIVPMVVS